MAASYRCEQLSLTGTIHRDVLSAPRIEAPVRTEALALLGYAMAEDRLFQMDVLRRRATGRLAELFGASAVASDKRALTLGFGAVAKASARLLCTRQHGLLDAFASGVNARIAELDANTFPFSKSGHMPDRWTVADCLVIEILLCDLLSTEIETKTCRTVMGKALPPELHAFLACEQDPFTHPLLGQAEAPLRVPDIVWERLAAAGRRRPPPEALIPGFPEGTPGSNAWAVAPSKSGGPALLANDLHLSLTVPGPLYPFAYDLPDLSAAGVGIPGCPGLLVGRNRNVAWGLTNFCGDTLDLILLTVVRGSPDLYLTAAGPRPFQLRHHKILVREGKDVHFDVRETVWGPVLQETVIGREVACRWTALDARQVDATLFDLETCRSTEELAQSARRAGGPAINLLAADSAGSIGWCVAGRFPRRNGEAHLEALEGSSLSPGPADVLSPDELPQMLAPPEGTLVSANHRIVTREGVRQLGQNFGAGFRCRRISDVLSQGSHGVEDALRLQLDTDPGFYDFYAELGVRALAGTLTDRIEAGREAARALEDLLARRNIAPGLAVASGLRDRLMREILSLLLAPCRKVDPQFHSNWKNVEAPLRALLAERPVSAFPFADQFADWDCYIAVLVLEALAAGPLQQPEPIQSPLAALLPGQRSQMELLGERHDGTRYSVRVGACPNGAVVRLVMSPGCPISLQMLGGVSENPASPHYRDAHELWRMGRAVAFPQSQ